ncbi:MAG: hypothetical protein JWN30_1097, partial [Bacilli bacterium]|nr:hypothetical protein [Bacilli bacterium]
MYKYNETQLRLNHHLCVLMDHYAAFRVHYWGANPRHFDNPLHKHSFFEVCYVLDGKGSYMDDGNEYPLDQGSLFCSRPGTIHQIRSFEGLNLLFVAFEVDEAKSTLDVVDRFRYLTSCAKVCVHSADESPTAFLWRSLLIRENENWEIDLVCLSSVARSLLLSFTGLFADHQDITEKTITSHSQMLLHQAK